MKKHSILLIDDDRQVLEAMGDWLRDQGYRLDAARGCQEGIAAIRKKAYDLVLSDVRLGDEDGFDLLKFSRQHAPETAVILLTGYGSVDMAVEAIRHGAFDFLTKPIMDDELQMAIDRALKQREVLAENKNLKQQLDLKFSLDNVIGQDRRMRRIFEVIDTVADTRATVLVTGESGTGKSLIARALHRRSSRKNKPFVEIACGALPENLLESELFGHAAGSFTGALGDKIGKFLQADGGTIFLDEIGTASPSMQVKLLRVLQELQFEAVGGNKTFTVDTRVVLATNEDLAKAVAAGRFRQDLYYRINVINVEIPSLRERISDIPLLAQHFLNEVCEESGKAPRQLTEDAIAALSSYSWPGNVRELQNVIERAVLLGKSETVTRDDLPNALRTESTPFLPTTSGQSLKQAMEGPERQFILGVLKQHHWNRQTTAEILGINRTTLYKKMKKLGLEDLALEAGATQ